MARREFAEHGLSGGRVDAIAAQMRTTKRMIYYYFGSKEGLYQAVLEQVYGDIRIIEQDLDLDSLEPPDAIKRMVTFTFDYEEAHPDFIRLVSIENIHNGAFVARSQENPRTECERDRDPGARPRTGAPVRRVPRRYHRHRPSYADQRILLL